MASKKIKLVSLTILSTSAIIVPILSTSCNETSTQKNSNIDRTKLSEGDAKTLSRKFISSVNKLVNDIKLNKIQISPKYEYKSMYANSEFWSIEKITDEYFNGLPTSINDLNIQNVTITYFDSPNGAMDLEIIIQNSKNEDEFTYRTITINGFEKEPIGLVLNRVYSEDSIKISPNWTNNKVSFATQINWPIEKITSDNFYNLLEPKYGIQPKLVDVIYDGTELGQLKLVYDFYYEEQLISTKMYTVSGFAKEDLVDKVNRLYGNVEIKPKRSATKYSANSLIWTTNKIISVWFDGLPQNQEGVTVSVKEVVTNGVLESQGALQVVFTFSSKDGNSIEKTFEIKGFYKDPDIAAYNLILAKEAFENINLRKDLDDLSKSELKDLYHKKTKLEDIFEIPNIPYVKMEYEVFCWRNWQEVNEKFDSGSFKIRFNLTDTVNGKTISVMSRTYFGMHDILGVWNEQFVFNKSWNHLIAKKENISWEKFYTSKGKGGLWDYSREGVIAARGQQNAVWIPFPIFTIMGGKMNSVAKAAKAKKLVKEAKYGSLSNTIKLSEKHLKEVKTGLVEFARFNQNKYELSLEFRDFLSKEVTKKENIWTNPFTKSEIQELVENLPSYRKMKDKNNLRHPALIKKERNRITREFNEYMEYYNKVMSNINNLIDIARSQKIDIEYLLTKYEYEQVIKNPADPSEKFSYPCLDMIKLEKKLIDKLKAKSNTLKQLIEGILTDILLGFVTPTLIPIYQSKADLTIYADWQGYYRYMMYTIKQDAEFAFGFVKPNRQRLDNFLSYDCENDKKPLLPEDFSFKEKYARKGAIEALRKLIIDRYTEEKELVFDSIEYESFNGVENCLKLPDGKENGLWSSNAYWFLSNYTFKVNYDGESLKIPFQMWLGTVDQIEYDTQYVIGDDRDLERDEISDDGVRRVFHWS